MPTTSAGCRRSESGVKSTTSANRIDAEANWSAIVPASALSLSAIERGRMFSSRLSARSCSTRSAASASSRWRTNCARSPNTTAPAKVTLSAIIVGANQAGKVGPLPVTWPTIPDTRNIARNATNQRTPERAPLNTRAPSGARMPHRPTAPEPMKPPTNAIEIVGASRMSSSSIRRNRSVSRVREKIAIAPTEMREVQPGDEARHGAEREVDRAPDERDREDQDADEDEQRLAQPAPRRRPADRRRSSRRDRSTAGRTERTRPSAEGNRPRPVRLSRCSSLRLHDTLPS